MVDAPQTLIDFANEFRPVASPGIETIVTPRYQVTLQPDVPIAGPNGVSWIRCTPDEVDEVVREARATAASRNLPLMWVIDPGTQPPDLADHLAARGIRADPHDPEVAVMVLPIGARIESPPVAGLEIHDALADPVLFRLADGAAAEAFMAITLEDDPVAVAAQDRRWVNACAAGNRHFLLATVSGKPAGSAWLTLYPPHGAMLNGGATREKFRGLGIYRALVAARLEIARRAGAGGLAVWGGGMSKPILQRLGFTQVGWRRFYVDPSVP